MHTWLVFYKLELFFQSFFCIHFWAMKEKYKNCINNVEMAQPFYVSTSWESLSRCHLSLPASIATSVQIVLARGSWSWRSNLQTRRVSELPHWDSRKISNNSQLREGHLGGHPSSLHCVDNLGSFTLWSSAITVMKSQYIFGQMFLYYWTKHLSRGSYSACLVSENATPV